MEYIEQMKEWRNEFLMETNEIKKEPRYNFQAFFSCFTVYCATGCVYRHTNLILIVIVEPIFSIEVASYYST